MTEQRLPLGTFWLPDQWHDQSRYQFVGPKSSDLDIGMLSGKGVRTNLGHPAFSAKIIEVPEGIALPEYVVDTIALLRKSFDTFHDVEEEQWIHAELGPALTVAFCYEPVPRLSVKQIQLYLKTETPRAYLNLGFATLESVFERERPTFRRIFESFESAGAKP